MTPKKPPKPKAKAKPIPGHKKLLNDIAAVEKAFKHRGFQGSFEMSIWGKHIGAPHSNMETEPTQCGTSACLAGWLGLLGGHEFKARFAKNGVLQAFNPHLSKNITFEQNASNVYGMNSKEIFKLFISPSAGLREKLAQARRIAAAIKERERE